VTKREKRLQHIQQNPNNVSLEELRQVLEDYGFKHQRTVGSHFTFSVDIEGRSHLLVVPFHRPVKPIYIKKALKLVDRVIEERGIDNESEND
jgi:predicted RNA binding protein YcfA (HicA-like mRNA interferase family)